MINHLRQKITLAKIIWVLFFLFIFVLLLRNSYTYLDADLGWHLRVGQDIVAEKAIPSQEKNNFTLEGKTWVDHEWLANTVLYLIYDKFGYLIVSIIFALLIIISLLIILLSVYQKLPAKTNPDLLILALLFLGIYASLPHWGIRIQEISFLFLAGMLWLLYNFENNKKIITLAWLVPLFYFWSCLHASFLIGLFVLGLWLGIKIIESLISKYFPNDFIDYSVQLSKKDYAFLTTLFLLCVAATLSTPYGLKLFNFLWEYKNTYYLTHIQEWRPSVYPPLCYAKILFLVLVMVSLLLNLYLTWQKKMKINLFLVFASTFFLAITIKSVRHFPLLFAISMSYILIILTNYLELSKPALDRWKINNLINKLIFFLFIIIFLLLIIFQLSLTRFNPDPFRYYTKRFPCGAAQYIKEKNLYHQKMLAYYDWGGYLIQMLPETRLFIDGRFSQVPFAGKTLLEEYNNFYVKGETENMLKKYGIQIVLANQKDFRQKYDWFEKIFFGLKDFEPKSSDKDLIDFLKKSPDWKISYQDDLSIVFEKK